MADPHEKINKIEEITESSSSGIAKELETADRIAPSREAFDTAMNKLPPMREATVTIVEQSPKPTLMDEVRDLNQKVENVGKSTTGDLVAQAKELITQIEGVKGKLAEPSLEIRDSVQTLLRNKLAHIDENLKVALNKAGVEYVPPTSSTKLANPIDRFLGFLTHGQFQLSNMATELEHLASNREELSPARMLAVQIKVGYIQQELEFFTNLLNKSLESTKTIMNVQV